MQCAVCDEIIEKDDIYPKCSRCLAVLHFKCTQGELHHATWQSMTLPEKNVWCCFSCKNVAGKHNLSSDSEDLDQTAKKICRTEENVSPQDIAEFMNKISKQLTLLDPIQKSVVSLDEKVTELQKDNAQFRDDLSRVNNHVTQLESSNKQLTERVNKLEQELNNSQQYRMRTQLIISGVPPQPEENTGELVEKILTSVEVQVKEYDLVEAHRLPKPKPRQRGGQVIQEHPSIIVQFHHQETKSTVIANSICLQPKQSILGTGTVENPNKRIYFNDHLTPLNRKLLMDAKHRLVKEAKFYSVQLRKEKILVKRSATSKPMRIQSTQEIDRLLVDGIVAPTSMQQSSNT